MPTLWTTRDKPAGVPVFPPHGGAPGPSVLSALLEAEPEREKVAWPIGFEGGICHRLDTATSGALLVARDLAALAEARRQFAEGRLRKRYLLVVSRDPPWDENACDRAIGHDARRARRMIVQRGLSTPHRGRWFPAHTVFRRISGRLFGAEMTTGVMHQIRVHAAFLGVPLAGDRQYGGDEGAFCLHHVGLVGEDGLQTDPVPDPPWVHRPG